VSDLAYPGQKRARQLGQRLDYVRGSSSGVIYPIFSGFFLPFRTARSARSRAQNVHGLGDHDD